MAGISTWGPPVTHGTPGAFILESQPSKSNAFSAPCLLRIGHLGGKSPQNPNLPLVRPMKLYNVFTSLRQDDTSF